MINSGVVAAIHVAGVRGDTSPCTPATTNKATFITNILV